MQVKENKIKIEIWDLKINNLAPVVTYFDKDTETGKSDHTPKTIVRFNVQG